MGSEIRAWQTFAAVLIVLSVLAASLAFVVVSTPVGRSVLSTSTTTLTATETRSSTSFLNSTFTLTLNTIESTTLTAFATYTSFAYDTTTTTVSSVMNTCTVALSFPVEIFLVPNVGGIVDFVSDSGMYNGATITVTPGPASFTYSYGYSSQVNMTAGQAYSILVQYQGTSAKYTLTAPAINSCRYYGTTWQLGLIFPLTGAA